MEQSKMEKAFEPSEKWYKAEKKRIICRDLLEGVDALRRKGETYLPKKEFEEITMYEKRLKTATLYNMFDKAIEGLVGRVFSKVMEPKDIPTQFEEIYEDIDFQGNNIDMFCKDVFSTAMAEGMSYIFVDYPPALPVETRDEEKRYKRRPYWVHYKPHEVIGHRFEKIEGVSTLTQVRIRQIIEKNEGDFGVKKQERVRVYEVGKCTEYIRDIDGENSTIEEKEYSMSFKKGIPIVPVYTGKKGLFEAEPQLYDLAIMNIRHYQSNSAQDHILDHTRFPLLFGKRIYGEGDEDEGVMGVGNMIHSNDTDADLRYVESTCAAIDAGAKSLRELEDRMAVMSNEPLLVRRSGQETATRVAIDSASAASSLQSWTLQLKDAIEQAMVLTAMWEGLDAKKGGSIQMNTDYNLILNDSDITNLTAIRKEGEMSRRTFWDEMSRRGIFGPDFDPEVEVERLHEEGAVRDSGDGLLLHMVRERVLPKQLLFNEIKRRGSVDLDIDWLDVKAMMEDDTRMDIGPVGDLSGFAQRLIQQREQETEETEE